MLAPKEAAEIVCIIKDLLGRCKNYSEGRTRRIQFLIRLLHWCKSSGLPSQFVNDFVKFFADLTGVWVLMSHVVALSSISPKILLWLCLASTLDSNLLPEPQAFIFEEIKEELQDRHWPPQRQRCDSIPASAY